MESKFELKGLLQKFMGKLTGGSNCDKNNKIDQRGGSKTINRKDFVIILAEKTNQKKKDIHKLLNAIFDTLDEEVVEKNNIISIKNICRIKLVDPNGLIGIKLQ